MTSYNPHIVRVFETVFRPWLHHRLAGIRLRGSVDAVADQRRVLVAANHVSWWDAFLVRELHRTTGLTHPLFTLMEEEQLRRYPFFRKMGVVGVSSSPSQVRRAVRTVTEHPGPFWLTVFPQGRIWPSWRRPLGFRSGVELFARELAPCAVLPLSLHLEMLAAPSPSAFLGIGEPVGIAAGETVSARALERSVEQLLDSTLATLSEYGEEAGPVWEERSEEAGPALRLRTRAVPAAAPSIRVDRFDS